MNHEIHRDKGIKCCTFGASHKNNEIAVGDFDVLDLFRVS